MAIAPVSCKRLRSRLWLKHLLREGSLCRMSGSTTAAWYRLWKFNSGKDRGGAARARPASAPRLTGLIHSACVLGAGRRSRMQLARCTPMSRLPMCDYNVPWRATTSEAGAALPEGSGPGGR